MSRGRKVWTLILHQRSADFRGLSWRYLVPKRRAMSTDMDRSCAMCDVRQMVESGLVLYAREKLDNARQGLSR